MLLIELVGVKLIVNEATLLGVNTDYWMLAPMIVPATLFVIVRAEVYY